MRERGQAVLERDLGQRGLPSGAGDGVQAVDRRRARSFLGALNSQTLLVWFGLLTLGISLALTLLIVSTGFTLLAEHLRPGRAAVWPLLIFTCTVAGLTCAVLALLQFVQLGVSRRADTDDVEDEQRWTEDLLAWSYTGLALPRPLGRSGVAALLKLRDSLQGEVSDRLRDLYEQQGWLAGDLARLRRRALPLVTRAEVIERLALLRHPVALDALAGELRHRNSEIRALALLAVARSVGRLNLPPQQQRRLSLTLRGAVVGGRFSVGQVQETLTLMDDAGLPLARELLHHAGPGLCAATLDVLARRRSPALHGEVLALLHSPHPEVRAGALKVLARSRDVPPEARAAALDLSYDPLPFVRVQAAKVAAQLDPLPELRLWMLLGDPHWWVRRAAARGLIRHPVGSALLARVAQQHPDRYARDMARGTLEGEPESGARR